MKDAENDRAPLPFFTIIKASNERVCLIWTMLYGFRWKVQIWFYDIEILKTVEIPYGKSICKHSGHEILRYYILRKTLCDLLKERRCQKKTSYEVTLTNSIYEWVLNHLCLIQINFQLLLNNYYYISTSRVIKSVEFPSKMKGKNHEEISEMRARQASTGA